MEVILGILGLVALAIVSFTLFFSCGTIARWAAPQSKGFGLVVVVLLLYGMFHLVILDFQIIYLSTGFGATVFGYALGRFLWRGKAKLDLLFWVGIAALLVNNTSSLGRHLDWKLIQDLKIASLLLVPAAVAYPIARIIRYHLKNSSAHVFDGFVALGMAYVLVMLFVSSGTIYYFPWGLSTGGPGESHLARIYVTWLARSPVPYVSIILALGVGLFLFLSYLSITQISNYRNTTSTLMLFGAVYFATSPLLAAAEGGEYIGLSIFLYAAITALGLVGYWSAVRGISKFPGKWVHGEHRQYVALLMFFLLFGLTVRSQTTFVGGIPGFDIPYFEIFVLLGTISLFWGVILGQRVGQMA